MFAVLCASIVCTMCTALESAVWGSDEDVYYSLSDLLVFESAITEYCSRTPGDYSRTPRGTRTTLKMSTLHYITDANINWFMNTLMLSILQPIS